MTRRIILFKDPVTQRVYRSDEFNGDKSEFPANSLDSCDANWDGILAEFQGVSTLPEFERANRRAQGHYHSFLDEKMGELKEYIPVEEISSAEIGQLNADETLTINF